MPQSLKREEAFAKFSVNYRQENGSLVMDEELRTESVTLPPEEYSHVKKFFDTVFGADAQNAVLVRN
jgi:hypothetical protein